MIQAIAVLTGARLSFCLLRFIKIICYISGYRSAKRATSFPISSGCYHFCFHCCVRRTLRLLFRGSQNNKTLRGLKPSTVARRHVRHNIVQKDYTLLSPIIIIIIIILPTLTCCLIVSLFCIYFSLSLSLLVYVACSVTPSSYNTKSNIYIYVQL